MPGDDLVAPAGDGRLSPSTEVNLDVAGEILVEAVGTEVVNSVVATHSTTGATGGRRGDGTTTDPRVRVP